MSPGQQAQYAACMQGKRQSAGRPDQAYGLLRLVSGSRRPDAASGGPAVDAKRRAQPAGGRGHRARRAGGLPRASDYGFFSGSERDRLLGQVNRLAPRQITCCSRMASRSAGKWSKGCARRGSWSWCRWAGQLWQDPCAVARQLKSAKPRLKINVVDITGEGYANCLAELTGGRVLSSTSGMPMDQMIIGGRERGPRSRRTVNEATISMQRVDILATVIPPSSTSPSPSGPSGRGLG